MTVNKLDHINHIHGILDIPNKTLRAFRAKHSLYFFTDPLKAFEEQVKVQRLYFAKMPQLSVRLQEMHIVSMKKLIIKTGEMFKVDVWNAWTSNDFQELLRIHHKQMWVYLKAKQPP